MDKSKYHWAANRIFSLEERVEELELIEVTARELIAAAKKRYWEDLWGDLDDELKALADALGERFPT